MLSLREEIAQDNSVARKFGKVTSFIGMVLEVNGLTAGVGEYCQIVSSRTNSQKEQLFLAEVVGFRNACLLLMPFDKGRGISLGDRVENTSHNAQIGISDSIVGRVVDPFCKPLDNKQLIAIDKVLELYPKPRNPLSKQTISKSIRTGIKVIDKFIPLGEGQRIGLFAGSGVGKTTLLKMLTRNISSDLKIIVLIGERGREVAEFVSTLGSDLNKQDFIVVAAAADQPPLARVHSLYTATAIAEHLCEKGRDVLLVVDSITRFAMAQREVGLAIGEPPTSKGYTPSVFSQIPSLVERAGNFKNSGSITAIYSVLVEGDDLDEPIADHMRSVLDGHIVLTRGLAEQNIYPSIDILKSKSRAEESLLNFDSRKANGEIIKHYAKYKMIQDLVELGVYEKGSNLENDKILSTKKFVDSFISQASIDMLSESEMKTAIENLEGSII